MSQDIIACFWWMEDRIVPEECSRTKWQKSLKNWDVKLPIIWMEGIVPSWHFWIRLQIIHINRNMKLQMEYLLRRDCNEQSTGNFIACMCCMQFRMYYCKDFDWYNPYMNFTGHIWGYKWFYIWQWSYWELQEHISKQNIEESMLVIKLIIMHKTIDLKARRKRNGFPQLEVSGWYACLPAALQ